MRILAALTMLAGLAGCAATEDMSRQTEPLGDFRLGFSEVVAPNIQKLFVSESATAAEWTEAVDRAVEARFGRFRGSRYYHLGMSVEGYSLPPPIVPGESYLAIRLTVWDDARQTKLNDEAELVLSIIVLENRLGMTRQERMASLARTAARDIETWLRKQQVEQGWFGGPDASLSAPPAVAAAPTVQATEPADAEVAAADVDAAGIEAGVIADALSGETAGEGAAAAVSGTDPAEDADPGDGAPGDRSGSGDAAPPPATEPDAGASTAPAPGPEAVTGQAGEAADQPADGTVAPVTTETLPPPGSAVPADPETGAAAGT